MKQLLPNEAPTIIRTFAGVDFDLSNPSPSDIDFRDISRSLKNTKRFNGMGAHGVTVAEHSVFVYLLSLMGAGFIKSRRMSTLCLMHDMHEAYIGDTVSPVKHELGNPAADLEVLIDECIYSVAKIFSPIPYEKKHVKHIDMLAYFFEANYLEGLDIDDSVLSDEDVRTISILIQFIGGLSVDDIHNLFDIICSIHVPDLFNARCVYGGEGPYNLAVSQGQDTGLSIDNTCKALIQRAMEAIDG